MGEKKAALGRRSSWREREGIGRAETAAGLVVTVAIEEGTGSFASIRIQKRRRTSLRCT